MSYKTEFQANNTDLQSILDKVNALQGGSEVESTFVPTDSGGTTYKSKFGDNNVDLQKILELAQSLPDVTIPVTITGAGDAGHSLVIINGTTYTAAASGIEVKPGDVIVCGLASAFNDTCCVFVDSALVFETNSEITDTYEWAVPGSTTAITIDLEVGINGGNIYITTS